MSYKKMDILNKQACRFCLSELNLYPLFPSGNVYELYKKYLFFITGLKVHPFDRLSQKICVKCAKFIETAMNFRNKCKKVENILLNMRKKESKSEKNTDDKNPVQIKLEKNPSPNFMNMEIKMEHGMKIEHAKNIKNESEHFNEHVDEMSNMSTRSETFPDTATINSKKQSDVESSKHYDNDGQSSSDTFLEELTKPKIMQKTDRPHWSAQAALKFLEESENKDIKTCKLCKKTFKSMSGFQHHTRFHFGLGLICEFCGFRCLATTVMLRHRRALHGVERDDKFPCSSCDFKALDKIQLQAHERHEHKRTHERRYVCNECGDAFFTKYVLVQHQSRHKTERPFECDMCSSKFKRRGKLNDHKRRCHAKILTYMKGCYLCPNQYRACCSARKHILKVHGIPRDQQGKLLRIKVT